MKLPQRFNYFLLISLATILLILFTFKIFDVDIALLRDIIVSPTFILIALVAAVIQAICDGLIGFSALKMAQPGAKKLMQVTSITLFSNTVGITLPGPAKSPIRAILQKIILDTPYKVSILALIYESLIAYLVLFPTAIVTSWIWLQSFSPKINISQAQLAALCFFLFLILLYALLKIRNKFITEAKGTYNEFPTYLDRKSSFTLYTVSLTCLLYLTGILRLDFVSISFGYELELGLISAFFLLSRITGILSMLPMGIGARDASLTALFVLAGIPLQVAVSIALIDRILLILSQIITGVPATQYLYKNWGKNRLSRIDL